MVLTRRQVQALISKTNKINTNSQVQIMEYRANHVIRPFEVNINPGYLQGIKLYLQATKNI